MHNPWNFLSFFSMVMRDILSRVVSTTWSYGARNDFTISVQIWIWLQSNFMYHLTTDSIRLSWKQWMSNLLFPICSTILWQNMVIWALRQMVQLYFMKSSILNLWGITIFGTKLSLISSIPFIELFPSIAFDISLIRLTFYLVSKLLGCIRNSKFFLSCSLRSSELSINAE